MRCWCGYLSGARYRLFAYGPADAIAIPKPHSLLPHLNPDWFYFSGTGLPRSSWKRGHQTGVIVVAVVVIVHTHPFNGPLSGTTQVGQYQKGKTNLDFTETRDSEWQWHRLDHTQTICTSLQTDNHTNTPPLSSNSSSS